MKNWKKFLTMVLALVMLNSGIAVTAHADGNADADVWDGTVDVSWYNETDTEFTLTKPAQLAGLAAIVNGKTDPNCPKIVGNQSLISSSVQQVTLPGHSETSAVPVGLAEHSFAGKTIKLGADMDMGGNTATTNWMPIGGLFCADTGNTSTILEAWFSGVLDGCGHKITNLYCDRHVSDWSYGQGIGLIGSIGVYEGENVPSLSPAVRNLSVSGSVSGNRMVGGIIGQMGSSSGNIYVENCANHASVYSTDSKGCGGIAGAAWADGGAIINCYNDGDILANVYNTPTGGICGSNGHLDIYCCYSVGTVYGTSNHGRGIGGNDDPGGAYTVSDCYYLSGSDNDPDSNGYYAGTNKSAAVSVKSQSSAEMKSSDFVQLLNVNGDAYVYNAGGYPQLFWEAGISGTCAVSIVNNADEGTVTATQTGNLPYGTIVYLSNTPASGWAFRKYSYNSKFTTGNYLTVSADAVISGKFVTQVAGVLNIVPNDACNIVVQRIDGDEYTTIASGDDVYEYNRLKVTVTWREGAYPSDPDLVYLAMNNPESNNAFSVAFTYTGDEETYTTSKSHTVTSKIAEEGINLTISVSAATTNKRWSDPGIGDTSWYSDDSAEFTISTARQLAGLAYLSKQGNTFAGKTIKLSTDINMANDDNSLGVRWWDGIGKSGAAFAGTFDGQNHLIYNLTASSDVTGAGLFLYTDGANISNVSVSGTGYAKGSVGGIAANASNTVFSGCRNYMNLSCPDGYTGCGGIAAGATNCTFSSCINYGSVSGYDRLGGIAGNLITDAQLTDCINYGSVTVTAAKGSSDGAGGLAGKSTLCTITRCANYGDISGSAWYTGGLFGSALGTSSKAMTVTDCYNAGTVTCTSVYAYSAAGGLMGRMDYVSLSNAFNYGTVSGAAYTGAIAGYDSFLNISSVTNVSYLNSSAGASCGTETGKTLTAAAKTASEMADKAYLNELNTDGCFVLNGSAVHPELSSAAGSAHTHSGGTATCCSQAVCESCHMPYGELNGDNHTGKTELRNASEAVWTTDGYTGDTCCAGCGEVLEAGTSIPCETGTVFSVYEQIGTEEPVLKRSYTAADFDKIYTNLDAKYLKRGTLSYQYWNNENETRMVFTRYVSLDLILADSGIIFSEGDTLKYSNQSVAYDEYAASCYYYSDKDTGVSMPAALGFCFNSGSDAVDELASEAKTNGKIVMGFGIKQSQYGDVGGFRLVQGIDSLTIVHTDEPTKNIKIGDINGDGTINVLDVGKAFLYVRGTQTPNGMQLICADVTGDRKLNVLDVGKIFNRVRNPETVFDAEN